MTITKNTNKGQELAAWTFSGAEGEGVAFGVGGAKAHDGKQGRRGTGRGLYKTIAMLGEDGDLVLMVDAKAAKECGVRVVVRGA